MEATKNYPGGNIGICKYPIIHPYLYIDITEVNHMTWLQNILNIIIRSHPKHTIKHAFSYKL